MPTPTQIPMLPAPTPTTLAITTPPPAPTAISPVELKLLPGEAVVGETSQSFAAKLVYKGGSSPGGASSIRLAAAVQLPGNKKVPPNTVLAVAKEGTIATAADAAAAGTAFMWKFTKTKDVLVSGNRCHLNLQAQGVEGRQCADDRGLRRICRGVRPGGAVRTELCGPQRCRRPVHWATRPGGLARNGHGTSPGGAHGPPAIA